MGNLTDWARALLEGRHYATLATQDDDGSLHLTPVWYLFRDQRLFVDVLRPGAERWVSGCGPVTILRGDEAREINAAIQARYLTTEGGSVDRNLWRRRGQSC